MCEDLWCFKHGMHVADCDCEDVEALLDELVWVNGQ